MKINELNIRHHFGGGVYMKQTFIPAGYQLEQHKHRFEHLSLLASGRALVNGEAYHGPAVIVIPALTPHSIVALSNCIWFCVHATSVTDPKEVDNTLIDKE